MAAQCGSGPEVTVSPVPAYTTYLHKHYCVKFIFKTVGEEIQFLQIL